MASPTSDEMDRLFFGLGALSAMLAVGAGAFGAHALRTRLTAEHLAVFETAAAIRCTMGWVCWRSRGR